MTRMFRSMLVLVPLLATPALAEVPSLDGGQPVTETLDRVTAAGGPDAARQEVSAVQVLAGFEGYDDAARVRAFWRSLGRGDKQDLVDYLAAELGRDQHEDSLDRLVEQLRQADPALGARVDKALGRPARGTPDAPESLSLRR